MPVSPRCIRLALLISLSFPAPAQRAVSGIYPHLAMFNAEGECGVGAVVPWADRLWVVTYAPHEPRGSSDKLYAVSKSLALEIRPESIGGTPANRLIHRESQQLFLGPYAIDAQGGVRVIPYERMFGRHTGVARHLDEPEHKVVYATMEEGVYEVDVATLAVTELWADEQRKDGRKAGLPGYHGKGFASAQGHYVYANNGDHAAQALRDPAVPSGVLAEWDGRASQWRVVRRNQFTEVTGPGGIEGSAPDAPLWSIGWDHRSLILMLRDRGVWSAFRLPKASHSYDGAHGWNTEWPRIRDVGEADLLMTMHGTFWRFPRGFRAGHTAGLAPRSTYLKVVGDFCRWGDRVVLGCDDTAKSEFLNKHPLKGELGAPGRSQSNLVFLAPEQLDGFGPALGRGALWLDDAVAADTPSDPYLLAGYPLRSLHVHAELPAGVTPKLTLEVDARGDGQWRTLRSVELTAAGVWLDLSADEGTWLRLRSDVALTRATAMLHGRGHDPRAGAAKLFAGVGERELPAALLWADAAGALRCLQGDKLYELSADLGLRAVDDPAGAAAVAKHAAIPASGIGADAASLFYRDPRGVRWRLPTGKALAGARICREVCTERNLLDVGGTFYEMPAENAGGFAKLRPICTHDRAIFDYTSWRGLLVLSGVDPEVASEHIVRSGDGACALWVGSVDDLWQFGKPRGVGGPWLDTEVRAGVPSDPYLCTGFDDKRVRLSHRGAQDVTMRIEADFTGDQRWRECARIVIAPGAIVEHHFPAAFAAYWLRVVADRDGVTTAQFTYR